MKGLIGFAMLYFISMLIASAGLASVASLQDVRGCIDASGGNDAIYFDCMSQYDTRNLDQDSRIEDLEMRMDEQDMNLFYLETWGE